MSDDDKIIIMRVADNEAWPKEFNGVSVGPLFGVGVNAISFGLINAIMAFVLYRQPGGGQLLAVVQRTVAGGVLAPRSGIKQQATIALPAATGCAPSTSDLVQAVPTSFGSVGVGDV